MKLYIFIFQLFLFVGLVSCKTKQVLVTEKELSDHTINGDSLGCAMHKLSDSERNFEYTLLSDAIFEEIAEENQVLVLYFTAKWCGPCQKMSPIVSKLKYELARKMRIEKVDYDINRKFALKYNIDEIPTILIFKNKKMVMRSIGAMDEVSLKKLISESI
ncbi:MAG: thioredoxin fold domain-containing protein [Pseudarcicella sp.]|nr:thioredoxin fold domain-containing protein [Pseudarcicella sp.]